MDDLHVAIWWRERTSLGDVSRATHEDVVLRHGITLFVAIQVCRDSKLGVGEVALLDKDLGAHARVDSGGWVVLETRTVDVAGTESDGWQARVDVAKVVVVEGDAEVAGVLGAVVVGVTDERCLPLFHGSAANCYTAKNMQTYMVVELGP